MGVGLRVGVGVGLRVGFGVGVLAGVLVAVGVAEKLTVAWSNGAKTRTKTDFVNGRFAVCWPIFGLFCVLATRLARRINTGWGEVPG